MCLSKNTASKIVAAVQTDAPCRAQINSWLRRLPASWGVSGPVRNLGYFVTFQDPSEEAIAAKVCTGIALCTVKAIKSALAGTPGIPEVQSVERIDRFGPNHTATLV